MATFITFPIIKFDVVSQNRTNLIKLANTYQFQKSNADILHRWCELIVKYNISQKYFVLEDFLKEHQAMGLYLYGEMVLSRSKILKRTAFELFKKLSEEMDPSSLANLTEILK